MMMKLQRGLITKITQINNCRYSDLIKTIIGNNKIATNSDLEKKPFWVAGRNIFQKDIQFTDNSSEHVKLAKDAS